jgi:hypothetical protein
MQYSIVKTNGQEFITVIIAGADAPFATNDANPNYEKIVAKVRAEDDEGLADLFDPSKAAAAKFESLSERVSVKAGRVYLDGDEIDNTLTEQIVRFIDAGVDDWQPLVAFFENVAENPNEHSREQLFTFLRENGSQLTITPDGYIVGYKGVRTRTNEESGEPEFVSIQSGYAIVDGDGGQRPGAEQPRLRGRDAALAGHARSVHGLLSRAARRRVQLRLDVDERGCGAGGRGEPARRGERAERPPRAEGPRLPVPGHRRGRRAGAWGSDSGA